MEVVELSQHQFYYYPFTSRALVSACFLSIFSRSFASHGATFASSSDTDASTSCEASICEASSIEVDGGDSGECGSSSPSSPMVPFSCDRMFESLGCPEVIVRVVKS